MAQNGWGTKELSTKPGKSLVIDIRVQPKSTCAVQPWDQTRNLTTSDQELSMLVNGLKSPGS